jgi:hypothetical protein
MEGGRFLALHDLALMDLDLDRKMDLGLDRMDRCLDRKMGLDLDRKMGLGLDRKMDLDCYLNDYFCGNQ